MRDPIEARISGLRRYEASSADAIIKAARRAGIPADTIIEVGGEIIPSGETNPFNAERFAENQSIH